jgi:hypothetical protein
MSKKSIGIGLVILGIVIIAVCLLGDLIGLGRNAEVIGIYQWFGAGVGLVVAVIGAILTWRYSRKP